MLAGSNNILVVNLAPIEQQMSGSSIRSLEIAKQLSAHFDTTLFSLSEDNKERIGLSGQLPMKIEAGSSTLVQQLAQHADVLFMQPYALTLFPELERLNKHIVLDLYNPVLLETLASLGSNSSNVKYRNRFVRYQSALPKADFSVCASESQRDYWLGLYCALGRLTPELHDFDPTFRKLIDIVPFGLASEPPDRTGPGMKDVVTGISSEDFVLIWGGGIWDWLDPLTIIRAVGSLHREFPQLKLYFMGSKPPNNAPRATEMVDRSRELAAQLGILNKHVFFGSSWVNYEDRVNYLLDADVAVSAHFNNIETHFSFRTRLLDHLWSGLPTLSTRGDTLSDLIAQEGAGEALNFQDEIGWAEAISRLISSTELQKRYRANAARLARRFHWQTAVEPLIEYCRQPHKLPPYKPLTKPSIMERINDLYQTGGSGLVVNRAIEILKQRLKTRS